MKNFEPICLKCKGLKIIIIALEDIKKDDYGRAEVRPCPSCQGLGVETWG